VVVQLPTVTTPASTATGSSGPALGPLRGEGVGATPTSIPTAVNDPPLALLAPALPALPPLPELPPPLHSVATSGTHVK
jgi:hypothetical protein